MIVVKVDKRLELMFIALRLSKYNERYPHLIYELKNFSYLNDVKKHFNKFKEHKVIKTLNEIVFNDRFSFNYGTPVGLALFLDENLNFHGQDQFPFNEMNGDRTQVLQFFEELKDFSKVSAFDKFFEEHKRFYQEELETFKRNMQLDDVIPFMQKIFKDNINNKHFIINLAELSTNGGFGHFVGDDVNCTDGKPMDKEGNAIEWGTYNSCVNKSHYLHEFCHSFINPLTFKYYKDIKKFKVNLENLDSNKRMYATQMAIINDSIIRAIQISYMKQNNYDYSVFLEWCEAYGFKAKALLTVSSKIDEIMADDTKDFEKEFLGVANIVAEAYAQQEAE